MTSTFIDQFGFNDEEFADQEENVNAPFDRISDINFSTNANEENPNRALFEAYCKEVMSTIGPSTPNSALFEACCNERISTFDDSGSDEEDVWEEKELTFSSVVESRQSTISTTSNDQGSDGSDNSSDSEEDAEDAPSPLRSDKPPPPKTSSPKPPASPASPSASEDTKMDVDNSDGWTATFDEAPMDAAPVAMDTGAGSWDDIATNKTATDDGNNPEPRSSSPVAMETNEAPTDGLRKGVAYLMASAPPDLATNVQQSARLPEVGESSTDPDDEFTSLRNSQPLANTVEAMNVDETPQQQTEQPNRTGGTEGKPASDTRPAETGESPAAEKAGGADGSREGSETVQGSPAKDGSSSLKQGNSDNRETRTSSSSPAPSPSASPTKPPQPNTPTSVGDKDQSNNNTQHQQQQQQQQQQGTEQSSPGNTNDPTEELSQNFNILSSGVTKKEGEEPKTAPPPGSPNTDNSHVNQTDPATTENSVEMKIGAMETMRPEGTKAPVETLVPATGAANGPV